MNTDELRAAAAKVLSAQSTVPLACVKLARHVQRMNAPIDLQACVGKTYQRDGNHCRIEYLDDGVDGVGIRWSEVAGGWQCFDVPKAMLLAWLAGAVEVKGEA